MQFRILWERSKWAVWATLAAVAAGLVWFFGRLLRSPKVDAPVELPKLPAVLQERAEAAEERALVIKASVSARADKDREALIQISKEPDAAERRRRLASFLRGL